MSDNDNKELRKEQLIELRQKQFEMAINGDVRMLIWLGKQILGQSEKQEITEVKPIDAILFDGL